VVLVEELISILAVGMVAGKEAEVVVLDPSVVSVEGPTTTQVV